MVENVIDQLIRHFSIFETKFPKPVMVPIEKRGFVFRHEAQTLELACFLKGVKLVSALQATKALLQLGFTQEVGILCRCMHDWIDDIIFLASDNPSCIQAKEKFLEDFFQEEVADYNDVLSRNKRDIVPRKKVHAAIADTLCKIGVGNPSDLKQNLSSPSSGFSGYVHAAYPHIMEMYGGKPSNFHFHLTGMANTPRQQEWDKQFCHNYKYRVILVSIIIARLLSVDDKKLQILLHSYEKAFPGTVSKENINEQISNLKKKGQDGQ